MTLQTIFCRKRASFLLSLMFHGVLFGAIIYISFQGETPPLEEKPEEATPMRMVAYNLQTPPPQKPIKKPEPPKPKPIKKVEPKPKPIEKPKPKKIEPKRTVPLKAKEPPKPVQEEQKPVEPVVEEVQAAPSVEAPPQPPQKTPQEIAKEQEEEYREVNFSVLRDMAGKNLVYPRVAKKMGWSGVVEIKLVVDTNGKLLEAKVVKSSGREILDKSALKAALALQDETLPKPQTRSEIILPIAFTLR